MSHAAELTWQSAPPERKFAVTIPCDAMAFPFALFLARQIHEQETDRVFDIVIAIDDHRTLPQGIDLTGIRVIELGPDPRIAALPRTRKISHASYYWIALTTAYNGVYDRVLFLDADIYLRRTGLNALFTDTPLSHAIAASPGGIEYHNRGADVTRFHKRENLPHDHIYRNGGVELVDIARANAEHIPDRLIDFRKSLGPKIASTDQSAMNCVLVGQLTVLSPIWNFLTLPWSEHLLDEFDPVLIHFADNPKPWIHVDGFEDSQFYEEYRTFLEQNFNMQDLTYRGFWGGPPPLRNPGNPLAKAWNRRKSRKRAAENQERRAHLEAIEKCDTATVRRFVDMSEL